MFAFWSTVKNEALCTLAASLLHPSVHCSPYARWLKALHQRWAAEELCGNLICNAVLSHLSSVPAIIEKDTSSNQISATHTQTPLWSVCCKVSITGLKQKLKWLTDHHTHTHKQKEEEHIHLMHLTEAGLSFIGWKRSRRATECCLFKQTGSNQRSSGQIKLPSDEMQKVHRLTFRTATFNDQNLRI